MSIPPSRPPSVGERIIWKMNPVIYANFRISRERVRQREQKDAIKTKILEMLRPKLAEKTIKPTQFPNQENVQKRLDNPVKSMLGKTNVTIHSPSPFGRGLTDSGT
jgi:hypothetical protein